MPTRPRARPTATRLFYGHWDRARARFLRLLGPARSTAAGPGLVHGGWAQPDLRRLGPA
ncbi:hypothetical protein [Streptomyces sp. STR69]|uniref:hypothetical protein n=1 Tax=Streptomyces sp. STR69 TaxID=1796942 RepID=UPI0021C88B9E|nr:hypothetical protein [Streptomyces sp. STR69]